MSARDDIAAHFTSDTLANQLLDAYRAEVLAKAGVKYEDCSVCGAAFSLGKSCGTCDFRARMAAERGEEATAEPDFPECVHCGNQSGPLTPTGDRYPSGAQKFECADGCERKATPRPTGHDTELLRTVAATLRDESARQPERVLVNKGLHHAAQLVDRMADQAKVTAPAATATPFFQVGHTYTRQNHGDTAEFQVRTIHIHPDHGQPVAFGFYRRQPRTSWHPYSSDDYLDGWTDTTQGGAK